MDQNQNPNSSIKPDIEKINQQMQNVIGNIENVIKGKREVISKVLVAMAANGHVLLHDVPGVGKTLLARSLAKSIDLKFKRVQFTPDLLPTDVSGVNIFNPKTREFEFNPGPVFTNILLGDEINRASPKTQSAMLEAMEERQVSVDNETYKLEAPFFVIATQNPVEHDGTYPLPAAQLDRFLMRLEIGYPDKQTEMEILEVNKEYVKPIEKIKTVIHGKDILYWQEIMSQIFVSPQMKEYIVDLARATRGEDEVKIGVSPRSTILLYKASQGVALLNGREYVIPDDVQYIIRDVFSHRLSESSRVGETVIDEILKKVTV